MKRVVIQKARLPLAAYLFIILLFPSDNAQMQPDTLPVISPVSQAEAEANVLSADPWTFFFSSWAADAEATLRLTKNSLEAYPNPSADARVYVGDPEDRIEGEFQVPDGMRPRVMFWVDVFSRFNTRMRVIHDRNNPGLIYGYLDLRPIYRISPSTATAEFRANQIEKKVLVQLKQRISVATGITKGDADNADEYEKVKRFLSAHGALGKSEGKKLINQLRTQSGQADEFLTALQRSTLLLPHIQSVFRSQDLPVGLARIPFVESSFNARAGSKVGAMGVWQFMPQTARELIHPHEEKLWSDPLRQTKSAAVLLKRQRNSLPDWGCAITAYNAGHGRIRNLVQQYKAKDFVTLLNGPANQALGFAGQNFYAEVLAANIVEHYKVELFGWHLTGSELVRGDRWFKNKEQCDL